MLKTLWSDNETNNRLATEKIKICGGLKNNLIYGGILNVKIN